MNIRLRLLPPLSLLLACLAAPLVAQDRVEIDGQSKPAYGRLLALEKARDVVVDLQQTVRGLRLRANCGNEEDERKKEGMKERRNEGLIS